MTNFWENDPIVAGSAGGASMVPPVQSRNFWENDPIASAAKQADERSFWEQAARVVAQGAAGLQRGVANAVGLVPDLVGQGLSAIHPSLGPGSPTYYSDKINDGLNAIGGAGERAITSVAPGMDLGGLEPENAYERLAYGAGKGVGDAAGFMLPGAALAKAAKTGGTAFGVGRAMTANPVLQASSGAVGGGVTEATDSPLLGAVASVATPFAASAGRRALTPFSTAIDPGSARGKSVARAMDDGFSLTPAQRTGSKALGGMERSLGVADDAAATQRKQVNQKALRSIGEVGDEVTPEVLDQAAKRIGGRFDDLAGRTSLKFDGKFSDAIDGVVRDHLRRLPTDQRPVLQSYVDDMRAMAAAGNADGYKEAASGLRRAIRQYQNRDPEMAAGLRKLAGALDDAVDVAGDPGLRSEWKQARGEWRNLLKLEKAQKGTGAADAVEGDLGLAQVRRAGAGEKGDLGSAGNMAEMMAGDASRASKSKFMLPSQMIRNDMTQRGIGGGAAWLLGSDPLLAGGAAIAAPYIMQGVGMGVKMAAKPVYQSGPVQQYLTNQAFAGPAWTPAGFAGVIAGHPAQEYRRRRPSNQR